MTFSYFVGNTGIVYDTRVFLQMYLFSKVRNRGGFCLLFKFDTIFYSGILFLTVI